jgi:regulatory protein
LEFGICLGFRVSNLGFKLFILDKKRLDSFEKAKNYAFLLLKYRLRSEGEIRLRLKKKKFQGQVIEEAIAFLKNRRFIDDSVFAKAWIESRIKRPLGMCRIEQELKSKGVAKETIACELSRVKKNYAEEDTVKEIAQARFKDLRNIEPMQAKRRLYAYLLRRGFSPDVVYDVIGQL